MKRLKIVQNLNRVLTKEIRHFDLISICNFVKLYEDDKYIIQFYVYDNWKGVALSIEDKIFEVILEDDSFSKLTKIPYDFFVTPYFFEDLESLDLEKSITDKLLKLNKEYQKKLKEKLERWNI